MPTLFNQMTHTTFQTTSQMPSFNLIKILLTLPLFRIQRENAFTLIKEPIHLHTQQTKIKDQITSD